MCPVWSINTRGAQKLGVFSRFREISISYIASHKFHMTLPLELRAHACDLSTTQTPRFTQILSSASNLPRFVRKRSMHIIDRGRGGGEASTTDSAAPPSLAALLVAA
eukprot:406579-Rhodomonas_salina.1